VDTLSIIRSCNCSMEKLNAKVTREMGFIFALKYRRISNN